MHNFDVPADTPANGAADQRRWYQILTGYHWFVLIVAALGWLFDCLDQQLFTLARPAVMETLVTDASNRDFYGKLATSIFIAGWACGGLFFGVLGDRIGRARTMLLTILLYSIFTGLSALSVTIWDFALYRFLTGLGVGGEFAVGVALVAEVMPHAARSQCLTLLQALSAIGNMSAALINFGLGMALEMGSLGGMKPWQIMFMIGAAPALLALLIRYRLKEPETWQKASHDDAVSKQLGSYRELFGNPTYRKHAILGLILGCSGIIGLWTVGFFTPDLMRQAQQPAVTKQIYDEELAAASSDKDRQEVQRAIDVRNEGQEIAASKTLRPINAQLQTKLKEQQPPDAGRVYQELLSAAPTSEQRSAAERVIQFNKKSQEVAADENLKTIKKRLDDKISGRLTRWQSYVLLMFNIGAACGMVGFGTLAYRIGRKPTFVIALLAAFTSTALGFWLLSEFWHIFVMVPIMGFCQLSLFAGYAIYFPELFPTRLRSTGTSFCYNVGRFVAAFGPLVDSFLKEVVFENTQDPTRTAGVAMSSVFLIGLFVLPFLPETRGKPLPE